MATTTSTYTNGNGASRVIPALGAPTAMRFSDIPSSIAVPVGGGDHNQEEEVEVDLKDLPDDHTELCTLLENEGAKKNIWMTIASAYAKQNKFDTAIDILDRGLNVLARVAPKDRTPLSTLQCWLFLGKSRQAPRVEPEGVPVAEARTKNYYLGKATTALNEASRVNPSFPPLVMARGVLSLLRASLQPPSKVLGPRQVDQSERVETLRQALKYFEDASRMAAGRNMMATLGKARAQYSLGKFQDALVSYQDVLAKVPDLHEPDPRIGIGCCLWQLNHVEEAREAWERALHLNPKSKVANILLGLCYLRESSSYDPLSAEYAAPYSKAMVEYVDRAYEIDPNYPLTCATMGGHFLPRLAMRTVETLARRAIELADANSIISDGWYLLARMEHYKDDEANLSQLLDWYGRADAARGGGARGFLLAKFGAAQTQILQNDIEGARFRLEGILQHHQNVLEAKLILGLIYAQEVLDAQVIGGRGDKSDALKKALSHLEAVRSAWKDSKKQIKPDQNVLVLLSKLYAADAPDKGLACLLQIEQMEVERLPIALQHQDEEDEAQRKSKQREYLAPELLNNIACFQYQMERYNEASETFQSALSACTKMAGEGNLTTDELITTISYNLARSYEGSHMPEEARKVYEGLLERHPEYSDAKTRLAFLEYRADPQDEGPKAMEELFESESSDLEVRALYGWYLRRTKRRTANLAEDPEWKHYKNTLQQFDKHDMYSLMGMGNLHLMLAREMKRDTDQDRERRHRQYQKAVEFFHKVLDLDPKNAYAAQGVAIALAEDKRDTAGAKQIFAKVRETLRDANVLINLGHIDGELRQFTKAIESYEAALAKDRQEDTQLLASLGRTWLNKARAEKSTAAMYSALQYSEKCLSLAPGQVHFQFNVAFVQYEVARLLMGMKENQRTLAEMEEAARGLDAATAAFSEIANAEHPPYPKHDLEQRANLTTTMKRQFERAMQTQREYETANAEKLAAAREARAAQLKEREEMKRKAEEEEAERKRKLQEERAQLMEASRRLAEERAQEEKRREEAEYTENSEGEKVRRKKKSRTKGEGKRRKKEDETGDEETGTEADSEEKKPRRKARRSTTPATDGEAPKKKRKLARKGEAIKSSKFKSAEFVDDSDDGEVATVDKPKDAFDMDDDESPEPESRGPETDVEMREADDDKGEDGDEDADEDEVDVVRAPARKAARRIEEDDEDDDEDEALGLANSNKPDNSGQPATEVVEDAEMDA